MTAPRTLVAVDPGLRRLGVAVFTDDRLVHAALVTSPVKKDRGGTAWYAMADAVWAHLHDDYLNRLTPDEFVLEVPQIYRFGKSKGDPDDLIQLAATGAAVGAVLRAQKATTYYPREWKGTVPGDVFVERIRGRLTPAERKAITPCAMSYEHNVLDAVGLGLFRLGRLGRKS